MTIPFTHIDHVYINGAWAAPEAGHEAVINPATGAVIGQAPQAGLRQVDAAIAAARDAFDKGPWPALSMDQRADVMQRMVEELRARQSEIAALIVAEVGCAQHITHAMQVANPISHLEAAIKYARRDEPERLPIDVTPNMFVPGGPQSIGGTTVVREPIGVVSAITGYNFPFLLNLAKIAPALLAGCTLVLKPSQFTPYSALLFGEIADAIGLPAGVLNVVTGGIAEGQLLCTDERVDMVTFTGSEGVGAAIMAQAAPTLKKVHLELGGKSAMIVRHDADVARAAAMAVGFLSVNAGQGCAIPTRLLVHNSIRPQFAQIARAVAAQIKVGDASDPGVTMGPLIRESQRAKVEHYIALGKQAGATLLCGGGRPAGLESGFFIEMSLFDDVTNDMAIAQDEIFGPVGCIIGFDSDNEAIAIANASRYGLNGAIETADAATGYAMALRIRAGSVALNGGTGTMSYAPIGGYKRSGIGREYGPNWMREYQHEKSVFYPIGR
ncbi:aldehyde dehydrogenase family protein [Novosphingobium sp. Fuku2-ISO-50]|uniref:aldehyde dehydrogenase family protein n=1 Tax=Novosphingobium sp. Fuku2-ISO-50 TaxID=1739114 RepID=UPI00076CC676|nr:aldehyde dehydrogenase family protein [Novosphingobium sp. Fuku2-ISO-50]KUR76705.1 aldehyde dehydrogenase [Novosphingobium sp. Fuku2-ISO-50]